MKSIHAFVIILLAITAIEASAQNPFLKKYAGSYYWLPFGVDYPTESSEKIIFTPDGKWTSTSRPVDDKGVAAKLPIKKFGSWKASGGTIQISCTEKGAPAAVEFKMDEGLFLSTDTYLQKIFISDPIYVNKYAGSYYILRDEDKPTVPTTKLFLTKDGRCVIATPNIDENGVVSSTPLKEASTWKARVGVIQVYYKEDDRDKVMEFTLTDNVFQDRHYQSLKKIPPPPPSNPYFKQYAGTYQMLTDGVPATDEMDRYDFTPDGKVSWTLYSTVNPDGSVSKEPIVKQGTWNPGAGLIRMFFVLGDFDMSSTDLLTDFRLRNGVFRNGKIFLKKVNAPVKK